MILELATHKQATDLKRLGFPQKGELCYNFEGKLICALSNHSEPVAVPLEIVTKWLRNEKNIHISVHPNCIRMSESFARGILEESYKGWNYHIINLPTHKFQLKEDKSQVYSTYEEALSAGVDEAINILIKT